MIGAIGTLIAPSTCEVNGRLFRIGQIVRRIHYDGLYLIQDFIEHFGGVVATVIWVEVGSTERVWVADLLVVEARINCPCDMCTGNYGPMRTITVDGETYRTNKTKGSGQ